MVATQSMMVKIGTPASDFKLNDTTTGEAFALKDAANKSVLLMFICNHCPYVVHIIDKLVQVAQYAEDKGIACVAINSNDVVKYPEDSPEKMKVFANKHAFHFPYLFDENQDIAKAYDAACTPDIFLYDANHKLYYRGQLDSSRPSNNKPVTGESLLHAINELLESKQPPSHQMPSIGCNIKWKS